MTNSRLLPRNGSSTSLVTYSFAINGERLPHELRVVGLEICKEVNRIPTATLVFHDGSPAEQDFPLSNQRYFVPGNEIEIFLGYHSHEDRVFKGMVVSQQVSIRSQSSYLEVGCKDVAYQMTLRRKGRFFEQLTDSAMVEELLQEYGFEGQIEGTSYVHPELVQYDVSDWDFLIMRMEMNGMVTRVNDGQFVIQKPDFNQQAMVQLTYGATVFEFDGLLESRDQFANLTAKTWDYTNQEVLEVPALEPSIQENGNLPAAELASQQGEAPAEFRHGGNVANGELQAWVDARLLKDRLSRTRGRVQVRGFSEIEPGQLVNLFGFGDRFNGPVYVAGIKHELAEGLWLTDIEFGLSPEWFAETHQVQPPLASGMLAGVHGLQIGVVTQIEQDPGGAYRIKVTLPTIDEQAEGVWARLATLDAGLQRGTFFLPELEDEVVMGFINDDPRDAIILGMLHSPNRNAPFTATAENSEKGYVSREGLKVVFQEEEKAIKLQTPARNELVISDEEEGFLFSDQHGNSIRMDRNGISLRSDSSITLEARQGIMQRAGTTWQAEANEQGKLSSRSTLEIKGQPVNIN